MNAPQRGRRRCCALVALLAGVLLLTLPPGAPGADTTGTPNQLVGAIDDVVGLYAQSLEQGNGQEARDLQRAMRDLLKALQQAEGMQQQQHHHRHKGGAFQRGMGQLADSAPGQQNQQQQDATASTSGTNASGSSSGGTGSSGQGSFGKGMKHFGDGSEEKHHHHHHGWFGKGLHEAGKGPGASSESLTGTPSGTTDKMPGFSKGSQTSTTPGSSSGKVSNKTSGGAINNGISTVTNNIRNIFNGPANVNINNGSQQQVTQTAKASLGKNVGQKKAATTGTSTAAATSTTTTGSSNARTPRTSGNSNTTTSVKATATASTSASGKAKASSSATTYATQTASAKGAATVAHASGSGSATTGAKSLTATTGKGLASGQVAQVGKMTSSNFKTSAKQTLTSGSAARKSGPSANFMAGRTAMPHNVGASVGSRPMAFHPAASVGKKR
jgi:hypothetical protein